ncbi:MAG TPA: tripartite tricarboxylate transporter substrate binding protein [Burkholderiales bacterium]|nr:tripartite tricarboxylate transporter substrate binding protein [Burkholderiales bacterium]
MQARVRFMRNLLIGSALIFTGMAASAQSYPAKPVRLVVPFAAGGPADAIARVVGEKLSAMWGQALVVENRGGAAGNIGAAAVAKSAPDGYTLLINATTHVINASMYTKLPYDPIRDFTPVTELASYMLVLVVHPSLPVRSVKDFVALAKAKPGQLTVANTGTGAPTHLAAELFKIAAGIDFVSVPYNGATQANIDLLGGHVLALFNNPVNALPQVQAGKLRALAVTGAKRLAIAPQLPTIAESGYPGFEAGTWYGVFGPASLPKDVVAKLHDDIVAVLHMPDVQQKLSAQGWGAIGNTPAEFAAVVKGDLDKWAKVIKAAGIRPES